VRRSYFQRSVVSPRLEWLRRHVGRFALIARRRAGCGFWSANDLSILVVERSGLPREQRGQR